MKIKVLGLDKGVCERCMSGRHEYWHHMSDAWSFIWDDLGLCVCHFQEGPKQRSIADGPPAECPYLVEHAVSQGVLE